MNTINRDQLKERMEQGMNFKLVMTMDNLSFDQAHIPGSVNYANFHQTLQNLNPEDEFVLYCSNPHCYANYRAYYDLRSHGFRNITSYLGGLEDWSSAGYPIEGTLANSKN